MKNTILLLSFYIEYNESELMRKLFIPPNLAKCYIYLDVNNNLNWKLFNFSDIKPSIKNLLDEDYWLQLHDILD